MSYIFFRYLRNEVHEKHCGCKFVLRKVLNQHQNLVESFQLKDFVFEKLYNSQCDTKDDANPLKEEQIPNCIYSVVLQLS